MDSEVGRKQYISDRKAYDDLLNNENREYEKEQLIVYYCFLCLARCVDDYDFLGKMNAEDRDIFVRRYWFFDSVAAIAKRHAMSVGSVKMNLYRSRKKLLKVLKKEGKHL